MNYEATFEDIAVGRIDTNGQPGIAFCAKRVLASQQGGR